MTMMTATGSVCVSDTSRPVSSRGGAENAGRENDGHEIDGPMCRA